MQGGQQNPMQYLLFVCFLRNITVRQHTVASVRFHQRPWKPIFSVSFLFSAITAYFSFKVTTILVILQVCFFCILCVVKAQMGGKDVHVCVGKYSIFESRVVRMLAYFTKLIKLLPHCPDKKDKLSCWVFNYWWITTLDICYAGVVGGPYISTSVQQSWNTNANAVDSERQWSLNMDSDHICLAAMETVPYLQTCCSL